MINVLNVNRSEQCFELKENLTFSIQHLGHLTFAGVGAKYDQMLNDKCSKC